MAETETAQRQSRGWTRYIPIAVIAVGAAVAFFLFRDYLSFDALADNREWLLEWRDDNIVLAALVYFAVYVLVVAFSVPGGAWMTIGGGFLFGTALATGLTVVAATIGAVAIFLAARTSLGEVLRSKAGGWLARIDREFEESGTSFLLIMRLIPAIPFFIANIVPAFLKVSLATYAWTTLVGIIPGTAVYASIGSGLGRLLDQGEKPDLGVISEPHVLGPLLGLALLAAVPVAIRKWRGRRV